MKRTAVLIATLALGLAACDSGGDQAQTPPQTPPPPPQTGTTPPGQQAATTNPPQQGAQTPPAQGQQPGGTQQSITIPGLGNLTLPIPTQGDAGPNAGQGIQIPGLPGLNLPNPFPQGQNGTASGPTARTEAPARGSLPPPTPGAYDAGGHMTWSFMESRATMVHAMIVNALTGQERTMAQPIPFHVVTETFEPNAAAGCTKASNQAVMLITSAMLVLAAGISETKAYDELAGTNTHETYAQEVVRQVQSKQPVGPVPATLLTGPLALDPHKLSRQEHLFDQQVAFIIGHELAHHYRGHTKCVIGRTSAQAQTDDLMRILSDAAPLFSQPREVEADMWSVTSMLEAGGTRPQGSWNEEGALLNLEFFGRLRDQGGAGLAMLFLSTHPAPQLRIPIVQTTVRQWRPGWRPMPTDVSGLPLPIPLPTGG